jgi:dienelactone hydrolase
VNIKASIILNIGQDPISKHQKSQDDKTTDPGFDRAAWREKHSSFAKSTSPKWIKTIAAKYGSNKTKYAAVGYCFGAPYVIDAISADGITPAGAFAHPTALTEDQFRGIQKPLLLSCAENDQAFPAERRHQAEDILKEEGKKYQVQLFQGVNHGFAVRCNLDDPYERYVKEQSYRGIVEWFNFWLEQ